MIEKKYTEMLLTITLMVMNIASFVFLSISYGDTGVRFLVDNFGLTAPAVLEQGQYYRFLTSMFVHFDIGHLANNMLLLGVLGYNIEREKGHIKFIIIYILSGLGGNALSFAMRYYFNQAIISGGASGAVFGLMGAVLGLYVKNRQPIGRLSGKGILIMIGISMYLGLSSSGIDNAAHIGGVITGFLIALLL